MVNSGELVPVRSGVFPSMLAYFHFFVGVEWWPCLWWTPPMMGNLYSAKQAAILGQLLPQDWIYFFFFFPLFPSLLLSSLSLLPSLYSPFLSNYLTTCAHIALFKSKHVFISYRHVGNPHILRFVWAVNKGILWGSEEVGSRNKWGNLTDHPCHHQCHWVPGSEIHKWVSHGSWLWGSHTH